MAKLITPLRGVKLGVGSAIHFVRPTDPSQTVCGVKVCAKCPSVKLKEVNAQKTKWCVRCLGPCSVK